MRSWGRRRDGLAKGGELHPVKLALIILKRAGEIPPLRTVVGMRTMVSGKTQGANRCGTAKTIRLIAAEDGLEPQSSIGFGQSIRLIRHVPARR